MTLTVSDGQNQDSTTIVVPVKPRKWTIPVVHSGEAKLFEKLTDLAQSFGRNVCTYDGVKGKQESGHILHRGSEAKQAKGFEPARIADGGPFDGNWLIFEHSVNVNRTSLISTDLFPDSDLWAKNVARGRGADVRALANSVRDH